MELVAVDETRLDSIRRKGKRRSDGTREEQDGEQGSLFFPGAGREAVANDGGPGCGRVDQLGRGDWAAMAVSFREAGRGRWSGESWAMIFFSLETCSGAAMPSCRLARAPKMHGGVIGQCM